MLLGLLFAGSILAQVLVPLLAEEEAQGIAEVAHLVVPYAIAGILAILCGQVALVIIGRLLLFVADDHIFTGPALRWVDGIIWCAVVATVICFAVPAHLLSTQGGGPGIVLFAAGALTAGAAFVLLMVVMRGLLQAAISNRDELAEVI